MNPASTLKIKQQNQTLSAKKQKQKKVKNTTKPVLVESSLCFKGVELTVEQSLYFRDKMFSYFKYEPKPVLPWSQLKHYSKEERKALNPKVCIPSRNCLALGFNEVSRTLEQKKAKIVVMSDMKPALLCKHIFQHCNMHHIPLLRIWNFKKISKECFGFSSMIMAFKEVENDIKLYEFYKSVQDFCSNANSSPSTSKTSLLDMQIELEKLVEHEKNIIEKSQKMLAEKRKKEAEKVVEKEYKDVYLTRIDLNKRTFVPQPKKESSKLFNADFIAIGNSTENVASSSKTQLDKLIIKKIKGNVNRKKNKNEQQN